MLGEFKCGQDAFVHLFRKKRTQMYTFLANFYPNSLWRSHVRR